MTRKIFALAICILTSISSFAQTPPDNEIWYTTTDGKIAELYEGNDNWDNQIISHTYDNGKGVVRANRAIEDYGIWEIEGEVFGFEIIGNHIETITLPNRLTKIGDEAFSYCTSLKSFNGKYASADGRCLIKDGVLLAFAPAGITSYTIPDSVTEIGGYAFEYCSSLTSINIPNSVTEIGSCAFRGCTSLTSINIPDSVTKIGDDAFEGCTSITSITIPNSVTEIWNHTFSGCTSLTNITIPDSVTKIGELAFHGCTSLTSINLPDSVTEIGGYAFWDCRSLTSVNIPNSVTKIEGSAFDGCTSLKSINIPDSVTEIGGYAFSGCTSLPIINKIRYADTYLVEAVDKSLTSYTIKAGTRFIGYGAFDGCTSLKSINIPDSVTEIGWDAFEGCTSLTNITIPDSVTKIGVEAFEGCTSLTNITIPDSVTEISGSAFWGCTSLPIINKIRYADTYLVEAVDKSLTSYTIKAGTRFIGGGAFEGCTSLANITIPDSVTKIGGGAFEGCTSLTSINIPNSVTEIGYRGFWDCNIKQITINAVTGNVFRGCDELDPSKVVAYTGKYASEDGSCLIKDGVLIDIIHTGLTSYDIPENITTIGKGVFKGCSTLKEITIPNSVTMIGEEAFEDCNIERITINAVTGNVFEGCGLLDPSKVVAYIGKYASEDGRCLIKDGVLIDYIHNGAERYEIPNGVTIISDEVFKGCSSLKSITIPESVTSIGSSAFKGCTSLTDITMPNSGIGIEYSAFEGYNIKQITINAVTGNIFRGCNGLGPSKVVAYTGKYASEDGRCLIKDGVLIDIIHTGLTSYDIPDGVTTIPDDTFRGCTELASLTLPQSLTTIGERAFMGCGITEITIPQGVATIGQDVFKGCTPSFIIKCLATIPPQIATLGIGEEIVIYVPNESVKLYKKAAGWEVYKKQIKPIKE